MPLIKIICWCDITKPVTGCSDLPTPMRISHESRQKKLRLPIFFSCKTYPLKSPLSLVEVLADFFLIILLNFVTLKNYTITSAIVCSPCNGR